MKGHTVNCLDPTRLTYKVPVQGRAFVVCVGKKRMYLGAFWVSISSFSWNGAKIVLDETYLRKRKLRILAPTSSADPRASPEIVYAVSRMAP